MELELNIFEYLDYRKYLNDYYEIKRKREKGFTHRKIGQLGGFDPGLFSKVITGQRDISLKMIVKFLEAFPLANEKEEEYFELLVRFNQAVTHSEKKFYLESLMLHRDPKIQHVDEAQYEFYDKWYYTAVRELLHLVPFDGDYQALGKKLNPPIGTRQVKKAIQILEKLDFIKPTKKGYEVTQKVLTSGYETKSVAVNNHVINSLELSKEALDRFADDQKNLSSITFTFKEDEFDNIVTKVREFRRELMAYISDSDGEDRVYQMNMQLFPVSNSVHYEEKRGRKASKGTKGE